MEKAGYDGGEDEGSRGPLLLVTESLDLPALDLSSMASPALTTDGGGADLYSATSEGVSMATEDKDVLSDWKEEEEEKDRDDKSVSGGLTDHPDQEECDEAHHDQTAPSEADSEQDERDKEQHDGDAKLEEKEEDDQQAESKSGEPHGEQHQRKSGESTSPSEKQTTPRRDSVLDDDVMTVECASPRDPVDLDEEKDCGRGTASRHLPEETRANTRAPDGRSAVVHPLPRPADLTAKADFTTRSTGYSVKSIFPVVYEAPSATNKAMIRDTASSAGHSKISQTSSQPPPPIPAMQPAEKSSFLSRIGLKKHESETLGRDVVERMQALQDEVETLKDQLQKATKGLNLQLQVAQSERNQFSQRNTRLKAQIATLVTDLTRTKADAAKLKVENELYAAKMPKLQAELSEETSQADEKHAVTIQSQLEITQLRAKVQVLQTRSVNLDTQIEKLTQELRAAKKELRRRAILHQQTEEMLKRVETELQESKTEHAQDILNAKNKLTATVRRMEHDHVKAAAEATKKYQQQLDEVKAVASKAVRRRKELEQANNSLVQQLADLKKRIETESDESKELTRQRREQESALMRAERTESSLRDQLCSVKAQLRNYEAERSKLLRYGSRSAPVVAQSVRQSKTGIHHRSDSPDRSKRVASPVKGVFETPQRVTDFNVATLCSCCRAILSCADRLESVDSVDWADDAKGPPATEDGNTVSTLECTRCPQLEQEIDKAHEELLQVRQLHANELQVQAAAFERAIAMVRGVR